MIYITDGVIKVSKPVKFNTDLLFLCLALHPG